MIRMLQLIFVISISVLQGQIESEYIPPVLFEIPALRMLDLSDTKLNILRETCSAQLSELYLNKNFFHKVFLRKQFFQTPYRKPLDSISL